MIKTMLEGLSLIDSTGFAILGTTITVLVLGVLANLWLRGRYARLERDLRRGENAQDGFASPVLRHIIHDASDAAARVGEPNTQAIVEDCFQADLRGMLLAERFVRSSTGLVIIVGLLGTFYGLTLSIGRIVHLVSGDATAVADITQGVSQGLTHALSGMAVAFSNSLVGVLAAVLLTFLGILSNVSDRRTAVMVQIETFLDRTFPRQGGAAGGVPRGFAESVARLDGVVTRFESALQAFASTTTDFHDFNAHLKDNVARLSLAFGDLSDTLKAQAQRTLPRG